MCNISAELEKVLKSIKLHSSTLEIFLRHMQDDNDMKGIHAALSLLEIYHKQFQDICIDNNIVYKINE